MIIAVDFDGTLRYTDGTENSALIDWIRSARSRGDKVILWTCRTGKALSAAVAWCRDRGIEFDAVNANLDGIRTAYEEDSRKVFADIYIDDKARRSEDIIAAPARRLSRNIRNRRGA